MVVASVEENMATKESEKSWFRYFQFEEGRDTPSDVRSILLIIFTLIASVTFQAGVNPPGGVWQDGAKAGRAIYSSQEGAFYVFLISNTLAFSNSILIILFLTHKFPFRFEMWVATASMAVTYGSAIFAVTPEEVIKFRYVLFVAAAPFLVRLIIHMFIRSKTSFRFPMHSPSVNPVPPN